MLDEKPDEIDLSGPGGPHFQADANESAEPGEQISAWQEVAPGRFMPRRVRGSCAGRALG